MVKIYYTKIKLLWDDQTFSKMLDRVSEMRKNKILSYNCKRDRILSLGAELLLNYGLKQFDQNFQYPLQLIEAKNKKPYLENENELYFNISHSEEYVSCAIGDIEMGIDIEQVGVVDAAIIKKCFVPNEIKRIIPDGVHPDAQEFYRLWTKKESFVKATGLGLLLKLNKFQILQTEIPTIYPNYNDITYFCKSYEDIPNYRISICQPNTDFPSTMQYIAESELFK